MHQPKNRNTRGSRCGVWAIAIAALAHGLPVAGGGPPWVEWVDETAIRLVADPSVGVSDTEEKDFAWGDVDHNGFDDLICVRKQLADSPGRRRNVLFLNEGVGEGHDFDGVLVDRTAEYVTDADDGGQGFLDETADRDVVLADVNADGWLDIITATAFGQGLPKTISHPRVYLNKGSLDGVWQGFVYQEGRIPTLPLAPNFHGVAAGDVTGDDYPDLYFIDYQSNLEDRLLVNDGTGTFTDATDSLPSGFVSSFFGTATEIVDLNGDGHNDIVKSTSGTIRVAYNSGGGAFVDWENIVTAAHYYVSTGDLNNDGKIDLIGPDDGIDKYLLNQGNGPDGFADFAVYSFPSSTQGFGSNSVTADLNNDGWSDVLISSMDVCCPSCSTPADILRNDGNAPNVAFTDAPGNLPQGTLEGVHDFAPMDVDGDGWLDLVLGRCTGLEIWMNQPPLLIVSSEPPDGAIDARQPSQPDGSDVAGWDSLFLTFSGNAEALGAKDFAVTTDPPGRTPSIMDVIALNEGVVLQFDQIIPLKAWTIVTHEASGSSVRIGFLPADVNNDRISNANDVLFLIDILNGVIDPPPPAYQTDTNRSGATNASDVLRVIDLLNGAGEFEVWLGANLPQ